NGLDCGDMNAEEVSARLTPSVDDYVLEVKGRDFATGESGAVLGRITASDVDMRYEGVLTSVENALAQQNEYAWIFSYFTDKTASYTITLTMSYDEEMAGRFVQTWDAFQPENMHESQKAYISEYSDIFNGYQVIPRTVSTRIDTVQAQKLIINALHNYTAELDLEELGCYEEAADQSEAKLNDAVNTANKWLSASVAYDWNDSEVVIDKEQLREWISMADDEPVLDAAQVRSFVKKQASAHDTYGKNGSFTTTHGVELTLHRASYGWKTDIDAETEELIKLIQAGGTVSREPVYSVAGRKKGTDDIGDSYVEVDLTHQHLYLYIDGAIVLETDFVSGTMKTGNATPQGIFGITYKKTDAVLHGADYETHVNYWMPFYGNYGMHDATWRRVFGGNIYINSGSHGCVNLPLDKAEEIYQYMSKGFPVICYYYEVDPLVSQETPSEDLNPGEAQNDEAGQSPDPAQAGEGGQTSGASQNDEAGQSPDPAQDGEGGRLPDAPQNGDTAQNPSAA
ncbi:MAG: L,D-transpeptidase family protein, partial [Muribaculum sp.]|nr:L,D-transpeptidase family protein [Muribaculum sp.]